MGTRAECIARVRRPPPHLYFVGSAIFHYLGPSFAVLLFARVPVPGVAWLRIVSAAMVFAVWRRPWRVLIDSPSTRWSIAGLGAVFAVMNYSFYFAIAALPLGTVAAIEFVGPIVLALVGDRSARNVAAVVICPLGLGAALPALADPVTLGAGIGVGVSSSVIPYVFDQLAMRRLPRATYALFVALLPATAVIVGVVVLRQIPTAVELAGVGLVIAGVVGHRMRDGIDADGTEPPRPRAAR